MKRLFQVCSKHRPAIFYFCVLIILIFGSGSGVSGQRQLRVEQGKKGSLTVNLENKCSYSAQFYINEKPDYLSFRRLIIWVNPVSTKLVVGTIDTSGLEIKVHHFTVVVECLNCVSGCRISSNYIFKFDLTVFKPAPLPIPTPTETPPLTETPPSIDAPKTFETPKSIETSAPTETPPPTETSPTSNPAIPYETADVTETPTVSPTKTQAKVPTETPVKTPFLPSSAPKTLLALAIPSRDAAPTPGAEASPQPTPEIPAIPENPAPTEVANAGNLSYLALVLVLIFALLIGSLVGKKLFEKWKYGTNAINLRELKEAMALKEDLSGKWLKKRKSQNIHAIGVGKISGTENYCIQLFVENANGQMPDNPPIDLLPERFRKYPIVIYEMPRAEFITENSRSRAREAHDTLIGGISGANANLSNEYGTIGYFCVPTILHPIRKFHREVYLLSNSHVFANLSNVEKTAKDLIQQPSPGEHKKSKFIASLENFVPIKFDNDTDDPNFADAAIAKIFRGKRHKLEIPVIGKINDFVSRDKVEIRQNCRKFGRTTGYTEGRIFSIHLSIWIRYASTGQESFFKEQFLIVPADTHEDFIRGGDSGSLLVDYETKALGLICAGANSNTNFGPENLPDIDLESLVASIPTEKIRSYGIANPISEVMKSLHVKLML